MKFFCDENLPKILISYLKTLPESNVKSIVSEELLGLSDQQIAQLAVKEKSIVVTFDKDFLAIDLPQLKIIHLKFPRTDPQEVLPYLKLAINLASKGQKRKGGFKIYTTKQAVRIGE